MKEVWICRGVMTEDGAEAHGPQYKTGDVEWCFSNGPPGDRGSSSDFATLEQGLLFNSGSIFHWVG
jgi:hypothetical protein